MFIKAMNILAGQRDGIVSAYEEIEQTAFDTSALVGEQKRMQEEMNVVLELRGQSISDNARMAQNQGDYESRYNSLTERFDTAQSELEKVSESILQMQAQRKMMKKFILEVKTMPEIISVFDENSWCALVDYVTVNSPSNVVFTMKKGLEIKI